MDYEAINKASWDERAPLHAASRDYKVEELISDGHLISDVVRFDLPLLGDISGLDCVHLQCHIGTDTLSLSRLGAASVMGLDFSSASLKEARRLAEATQGSGGERLKFVEASVYESLKVLPKGQFDLVFTGIGALCWIPSIGEWAKVVSGLLRSGGRLFIREGHPILMAIDDTQQDKLTVDLPYFERADPTMFHYGSTYVDTSGRTLEARETAEFNHGIGEIIQALLSEGLRITGFTEHQSIPWLALRGQMEADEMGEYRLVDRPWRLPLSFTLQAVKE